MRIQRNGRSLNGLDAERRDNAFAWVTRPSYLFQQFGKLRPSEIFKVCYAQEKRFEAINGAQFLDSLDRMQLFEGPIFSEERESRARKAHEFGLLITRPRSSKTDWRYTGLVKKLKKLRDPNLRWLLIARWLEGEGVCKAEEFLPKEILKRLLTRARNTRFQVSPGDLQLARFVRIWLPYFERLLDDRKKLLGKRRGVVGAMKELPKLGYVETAIRSTIGKREPVQATITWLTSRGEGYQANEIEESTLQKAYSRVEAAKRKADAKFHKWLERHPHQVDPFEYHNFLHLIS
jgi:hypothetical protein